MLLPFPVRRGGQLASRDTVLPLAIHGRRRIGRLGPVFRAEASLLPTAGGPWLGRMQWLNDGCRPFGTGDGPAYPQPALRRHSRDPSGFAGIQAALPAG
jgi:hypothetical protein